MTDRALVTNDDGIDTHGLVILARAAQRAGLAVTVAAPSWNSSGASCALTGVRDDGRLMVAARSLSGVDGPCFAVDASPALIALVALRGGFGAPPQFVLSGVNRGRNTGRAVIHSGTVGAALTGINHGAVGLAVSLDAEVPEHWETAAAVAVAVIGWLIDARPPAAINVNVPDLPFMDLAGLRPAPLASIGAVQTNVTDASLGYVEMTYEAVVDEPEPGSDADLLRQGWAVVSAIEAIASVTLTDLPGTPSGMAVPLPGRSLAEPLLG
jgi:5'-nucleotidase